MHIRGSAQGLVRQASPGDLLGSARNIYSTISFSVCYNRHFQLSVSVVLNSVCMQPLVDIFGKLRDTGSWAGAFPGINPQDDSAE
jgi:hypothetical protein